MASWRPRLDITVQTIELPESLPSSFRARAQSAKIRSPETVAPLASEKITRSASIERDTHISTLFFDHPASELGIKGAYACVDVDAVRVDAELHDLGAELFKDERGEQIASAMSAIDDNLHTFEV